MSLPLPKSLSPSKVASFKDCALAFRFSAIDRVPEASSPHAVKGTLVHRALELLFWEVPQGERSIDAALERLVRAQAELPEDPEFVDLGLTDDEAATFFAEAEVLVRKYFDLEDPNSVRAIGMEVMLEVDLGTLKLRGIIDRLELDENGDLVVTDYKTGKAPRESFEQGRLGGVHFYAFLCERVLGRRPARVQLLYLADPVAIIATPSEQSIRGLQTRTTAIWTAVEKACLREDFRPKPSGLCPYCSFQQYCPAFGGNPDDARQAVSLGRKVPAAVA